MKFAFIDWGRLVLCLFIGAVFGLGNGVFWPSLFVSSLAYIAWQSHDIERVFDWIKGGTKFNKTPNLSGNLSYFTTALYRSRKAEYQRRSRLKKTLRWFSSSAALLPDATLILAPTHEIIWANASTENYLGINSSTDRGLRLTNIIRDPKLADLLQNDRKVHELEIASPQDPQLILALRVMPYADGNLMLSARDISQRVAAQSMRRNFIDNASHELRTPLTVVQGYLELLCDDQTLAANARSQINAMNQQTRRMVDIVDDMLTLSRLESTVLERDDGQWYDISHAITDYVKQLQECGLAKNHQINLDLDANLKLLCIPKEISSVFSNLIRNAINYTPEGSTIKLRWSIKANAAVLRVGDDGPGIAPQHLNRLTERFYRVDDGRSREVGGTGLGLAICKHVVQRHGGKFTLRSTLSRGTVFWAQFPVERSQRDS